MAAQLVNQEIPSLFIKQQIHCRFHKSLSLVSVVMNLNLVHSLKPYFRLNILNLSALVPRIL
jgi:hypothetical protein